MGWGPPDLRGGSVFPLSSPGTGIPVWVSVGPPWLSAAHAALDVHEAHALPAFPLLGHLGLNMPTAQATWCPLHRPTLPPRTQLLFNTADGSRPLGCSKDVSPKPSSISVTTPDVVQLGNPT